MKFLDISFNRLITLSNIHIFSRLKHLNLSNNYIADDQLLFLQSLINLKYLSLSNNNLKTSNISSIISELKNLETLNISHNQIEFLIFDRPNENLTNLEVDSNKLITIEFKTKFLGLKTISACNNKLGNLSFIAFTGNTGNFLPNLEKLIVNDNSFENSEIFSDFKNSKLKNLNLKNNYLNKLCINLNSESDYSELENLEMSCNNLNEFSLDVNFSNNLCKNTSKSYLPCIKSIYLDNNKLTKINLNFLDKNYDFNFIKNLEILDVNNNLLQNPKFLIYLTPTNLMYLNISFNNFNNFHEIIQILKNFKNLKEFTTLENNFNKNFYDIQLLGEKIFDCIFDYLKFLQNDREFNKMIRESITQVLSGVGSFTSNHSIGLFKELLDFRAYSIIKIPSLNRLDTIFISDQERKSVLNSAKDNNYLNKSNQKIASSIYFSNEKSECEENLQSNKSVRVSPKNEKSLEINENKINFPLCEKNRCETIPIVIETPLKNEILMKTEETLTKQTKILAKFSDNKKTDLPIQINPEYTKVYHMFKKTFFRLCDKNGYMKFPECYSLIKDLSRFYSLKNEMKLFLKNLNQMALAESNIFPGKIHFKEFTTLLKNEKFVNIFKIIKERLNSCNSGTLFKDLNTDDRMQERSEQQVKYVKLTEEKNCENNIMLNVELHKKTKETNSNKFKNSNFKKNEIQIQNTEKLLKIEENKKLKSTSNQSITTKNTFKTCKNTTPFKTPLLSKKNTYVQSNSHSLTNSQKFNSKSEKIQEKDFNSLNILSLLQSQMLNISKSNNNQSLNSLDLNSKFYLLKLINNFASPPFPVKYSSCKKKYLYEIYSYEKEYLFISQIFKSYNLDKFNLKKFYCQEFYYKILEGYNNPDFIFENNIYLFYGLFNDIINNFITPDEECEDESRNDFENILRNNNYKSQTYYEVILDEDFEKLLIKIGNEKIKNHNKFVIYLLIHKNLTNNEEEYILSKGKSLRTESSKPR